jgi:phosphoglycolate phosphatase-like HAD superfamily hydrolase
MLMEKRVKGVLFDFDGTLVYLGVDWGAVRKQLAALAKKYKVSFSEASVSQSIRDGYKSLLKNPKTKKDAQKYLDGSYRILKEAETAGVDKGRLVPGAKEVLKWLVEADIPVAILSNNDSSCVKKAFAKFGLPVPAVIVGRDTVSSPKPSTEGAELALKFMGLEPGECWLVGDSQPDLEVGKSLGCNVIYIQPAAVETDNNQPGVLVTDNMAHVKSLLQSECNN